MLRTQRRITWMRSIVVLFAATVSAAALRAQTIETPVPFDSAHRVMSVSPSVAERLRLAPPAWPVQGAYRETRLYSVSPAGGYMLVVARLSGALERIPLSSSERDVLGAAIDGAMSASGRPSAELASDIVSEPAGNAFARHQTFLAALVYGPLAASLADDGSVAGAAYLAMTGATFFVSYAAAQSTQFTRAQSDLAADMGLAVGGAGWLLGYAATNESNKGIRALSLASAIGGTIAGVTLGRTLSDAEAHGATLGMESTAALAVAATGIAGASRQSTAAIVAVSGLAGYPIGVRYPRHVGYSVTAGDVEAASTTGLVGVLFGAAALGNIDGPSFRQTSTYLAPAYLAGVFIGDRVFARQFDLTQAQANILNVGAVAGALVGVAVPTLSGNSNQTFIFGAAGVGAALGMSVIATGFVRPPSVASRLGSASKARPGRMARFEFAPVGAIALLGGVRGRQTLGRFTF
jgi:hypothetical protein